MTGPTATRVAALVLAAALTGALVGCSDEESSGTAAADATSSEAPASGAEARHNDTDVAFIQGMVPHHEGALAMAELAPGRTETPRVRDLAERIAAAQGPEIEQMQRLAQAWDVKLSADAMGGGMPGHGGMPMGDAAGLEALTGAAFDRAFLAQMIAHHEGAVTMSQRELEQGENDRARAMAEDIVAGQTTEIAQMRELLRLR